MSCAAFKKKKSGASPLCEESGPIPRKAASAVRRQPNFSCLCDCLLQHAILFSTLSYTSDILPCLRCPFLHAEIDLSNFCSFFDFYPEEHAPSVSRRRVEWPDTFRRHPRVDSNGDFCSDWGYGESTGPIVNRRVNESKATVLHPQRSDLIS